MMSFDVGNPNLGSKLSISPGIVPLRGPERAFLLFLPFFGLFLVFIKTPNVSYTFKCFFEVPTRCWRVFQLFLVFVKYKRGL